MVIRDFNGCNWGNFKSDQKAKKGNLKDYDSTPSSNNKVWLRLSDVGPTN